MAVREIILDQRNFVKKIGVTANGNKMENQFNLNSHILAVVNEADGIVGEVPAVSGILVSESGFGVENTTVITLTDFVIDVIAAAADEAVGALVYTLPAGAVIVKSAQMNIALSNTDTNIDLDTPDVGVGSVIATGANALLGALATYEDIITGQTATDVTGTATVKTAIPTAGVPFVIESAGAHTIHLNIADGWAGDETVGVTATGTITLNWTYVG